MSTRLTEELTNLADQVVVVDLHSGVLAKSRQLRTRRLAGVAAGVAVTLVAGTAAITLLPKSGATPQPLESMPPPTSAQPTSPSPTTPPPTSAPPTSAPPTLAPPTPLRLVPGSGPPSVVYYVSPAMSSESQLRVWRPDGRAAVRPPTLPESVAALNAAVSPDLRRLSWVDGDELQISDLDGSKRRTLRTGVDNMCTEPVWTADSRRLLVRDIATSQVGYVDVASGSFQVLAGIRGCHFRFSANGMRMAWADGSGTALWVASTDGTQRRQVPIGDRLVYDVESLSATGDRVAVIRYRPDGPVGDAARQLGSNAILRVDTGANVAPSGMRQCVQLPDGRSLVRLAGGRLVVLGSDGRTSWEGREPAEFSSAAILAVR